MWLCAADGVRQVYMLLAPGLVLVCVIVVLVIGVIIIVVKIIFANFLLSDHLLIIVIVPVTHLLRRGLTVTPYRIHLYLNVIRLLLWRVGLAVIVGGVVGG